MLAQGTRYNAEKKKVGMYHSTPIWSFRCKCSSHSGCTNHFEIETDPKNTRYVVVSGARRKEEEWERDEEEDGNQYSMAGKMIDLEGMGDLIDDRVDNTDVGPQSWQIPPLLCLFQQPKYS